MKKMILALTAIFAAVPALAEEGMTMAAANSDAGSIAFAAAIAICVAAFGGAFAQGMAAKAALEGIARNPAAQPKLFVPMIIGLALIESLVIYALIIAFQLVGKI